MGNEISTSAVAGLTRDVGFEIGVSRTIDAPIDAVWQYLISEQGVERWLGGGLVLPAAKGDRFRTPDGTSGEIRSYQPRDRMRLTWQPAGWDHPSTVQVAVVAKGDRTMLRFHQERLADPDERAMQRAHWSAVIHAVIDDLTPADGGGPGRRG